MKTTNDLTQLDKFIALKNGYTPVQPKEKRTVWNVEYLGKVQYTGNYASCVKFKNQFKQQRDYKNYLIK